MAHVSLVPSLFYSKCADCLLARLNAAISFLPWSDQPSMVELWPFAVNLQCSQEDRLDGERKKVGQEGCCRVPSSSSSSSGNLAHREGMIHLCVTKNFSPTQFHLEIWYTSDRSCNINVPDALSSFRSAIHSVCSDRASLFRQA